MNHLFIPFSEKRIKFFLFVFLFFSILSTNLYAQRGYYDAPYKRYEANAGQLSNGAAVTSKSYAQSDVQSEATDQQCVNMSAANAAVQWTLSEAADGLVVRYSIPDGQTATLGVYDGNTKITTLTLTTTWSWEYLWNNGNPNNGGISNQNPRMRFDEVHYKLPSKIAQSRTLKLVRETGNISLDFAEMEPVPAMATAPSGAVTYTGNGSDLQTFIDGNGGKKIFIPSGVFNVSRELYFGTSNTSLVGAGMWYTQINFTNATSGNGGLRANASNISFADLYLSTNAASRSNSYKAINGVFTATSTIKNIWAEHFECGAWIAQYNVGGPAIADGFTVSNCRFRNNYADGINLCKGTANAIVEHCSFRNNGDDDQAIWSADGLECINNTFRFNTSENCWRACGLAIYGGKNNKAYNLIIKDNLEAGIRVSNNFPGAPFNNDGLHEIHDITITACGTFNDTYNNPVAAIDVFSATTAGNQVKNVQLYNLDILDSRNDAISISNRSGDGIYNLTFKDITVNGTGKEYPNNNALNRNWGRGFFVLIAGSPNGNGTYCNMNYSNRGGSATVNEDTSGKGAFSWMPGSNCSNTSIAVTGITITPTTATLSVGATQQLTSTVAPANATNKTVTYSSNNTAVATVNGAGLVTAVAAGSAIITVTTQDGAKTATASITVNTSNVAVTSVSLSPTSTTLTVGGTQQLTSTILPSNAANKAVTYSSNNTGIATVNGSGLVTAISAGSAIITVTTQDGAKTATTAITVNANSNSSFTVNFFRPAAWGTAIKIYWWSAMPTGTLADASWPGVTMTDAGNGWYSYTFTNITSTNLIFNDGTNQTADLNRNKTGWYMNNTWSDTNPGTSIAVTGVTVSPATLTLAVGGIQQLTPTVAPATATNKTVTYSSNNTSVATVNGSGLVTAVSAGSAIITVTTQDGAKTATAAITVNTSNVAVTSVSLSPASVTLAVGGTQQLTPTILPSNASNKSVSYASNNTAVATVNGSGLVTAVANGTATISVTTADGNKTSTAAITVATGTGAYFTIKNKWTNNYLFDAGANVGYGPSVTNNNYKWEKVAIDATYFLLKNVATGDVMHIENLTGSVQCTAGSSSWMSAQWLNENVDGTYVRIKNRWQTGAMIHVENQTGSAQYNGGQNNWDSAQWLFQSTTTAKIDSGKTQIGANNTEIGIYPNPSINNEFNVVLPELYGNDVATVTVTDINGRKVLVNKLNSSGKINHNLASGIYVVTISSNTFNVTKKLIVK